MEDVKRIPYGVSDFEEVIKENMYYVDKTQYLPLLEQQPRSLFFIRPRRFGKSLFMNMLVAYYDIARKDRFDELFGGLWIGSHPTVNQGKYQVLTLDFSVIDSNLDSLADEFDAYCSIQVNAFARKYEQYYYPGFAEEVEQQPTATSRLNFVNNKAKELRHSLYLIVDEYDNFTNVVLNQLGEEVYHAITHASGFYRGIFKIFKAMFSRIFLTGVSPVTLDDLTSGFNIGWHLSTHPRFNSMLGFSEDEVRTMFRYYHEAGMLQGDIEAMIEEMKPWYNNYCFAVERVDREHVFNSDAVLYYLNYRIDRGCSPKDMIDPNTRTDYNKMKRLIMLDRLDGDRKGVLRRITEDGRITCDLATSFPAKQLTDPEIFPSLLFYYGMLTIEAVSGDMYVLSIPNNNVRKQYYEYALEDYQSESSTSLTQLRLLYRALAFDGGWQPALQFIADAYHENSSVRSAIEGERNIQGFFTAYLSANSYYLLAPEVELNHGYADFFLLPDHLRYPEVAHSYIIELKYLPAKDYEAKAQVQWQEAVAQIHGYAQGPKVQLMAQGTQLHCIVLQFAGWELKRMEEV